MFTTNGIWENAKKVTANDKRLLNTSSSAFFATSLATINHSAREPSSRVFMYSSIKAQPSGVVHPRKNTNTVFLNT